MTDNNAANRRRDDRVNFMRRKMQPDLPAQNLRVIGILQHFGALKIIGAVRTGSQNKMAFE